jgi:signal transduction histidine kinase
VDRISHAVDRMAAMIDTLLAYATARDAPLRTRTVELGTLVADVLHDRTAHLPPEERPEVRIGPLPAVRADPAMLRHVLENLVGNAIKYVRPGSTARVEVTAAADAQGWARIDVADRGIGIPDRDKPAVFEQFHRAHVESDYAGTGLGLAICKRIVERHGGEIGVADNPGGGTRIYFTLPVSKETDVSTSEERDDEQARTRLERALAERAAMEELQMPGISPLPADDRPPARPSAGSTPAPPTGPGRTA